MIRINKGDAPEGLIQRGDAARKKLCASYGAGARDFRFDRNIYRDEAVKQALLDSHYGKCCFCETWIVHVCGDVEHFRPKKSVRPDRISASQKPGYYWLAYEWDNLFLCCSICNQTFKQDFFPLSDPSKRARCHTDKLSGERPLFLHPEHDKPEKHIGFRGKVIYAKSPRGKETIDLIGLDRRDLDEARGRRLAQLKQFQRIDKNLSSKERLDEDEAELLADARAELAAAVLDSAPYAAMARAFLLGG